MAPGNVEHSTSNVQHRRRKLQMGNHSRGATSEDALGQLLWFTDFDVVGDVLAGGDVGEAFVHFADDVEDDADVHRLVKFGEDDFIDADFGKAGNCVFDAFLGRGGGEDEVNFVGGGDAEKVFELVEL